MQNAQKPSVGRIVHVKIAEQPDGAGGTVPEVRPAIIVRVWNNDTVNLRVFLDGTNDDGKPFGSSYGEHRTSVIYGDQLGQWLWPSKA